MGGLQELAPFGFGGQLNLLDDLDPERFNGDFVVHKAVVRVRRESKATRQGGG